MKCFTTLLCLLAIQPLRAQNATPETGDWQKATLEERYHMMKSKSQTFQDYKVIKENVLDGVWKITRDSIRTNKARLTEAKGTISSMEAEMKDIRLVLEQEEASMEEMVYASTHISVAGVSLAKRMFVGMVVVTLLGLLLMLGALIGKLKLMNSSLKEKIDLINSTSFEFEDYKRKSLDRQTKLSRELQNERNKLIEIRRG